jgi:hypothetical protein
MRIAPFTANATNSSASLSSSHDNDVPGAGCSSPPCGGAPAGRGRPHRRTARDQHSNASARSPDAPGGGGLAQLGLDLLLWSDVANDRGEALRRAFRRGVGENHLRDGDLSPVPAAQRRLTTPGARAFRNRDACARHQFRCPARVVVHDWCPGGVLVRGNSWHHSTGRVSGPALPLDVCAVLRRMRPELGPDARARLELPSDGRLSGVRVRVRALSAPVPQLSGHDAGYGTERPGLTSSPAARR